VSSNVRKPQVDETRGFEFQHPDLILSGKDGAK
jgi:hypothetical protein